MRADRLLAILLHLNTERRVTSGELARRFEVSSRTIHRDMEALSAAGVPVTAGRGVKGGWFLLEPFRTDLSGLTLAEALGLFVPAPSGVLAQLGLANTAAVGSAKLHASLPAALRTQVDLFRSCLFVDAPGWKQANEEVEHLGVLLTALSRAKQLRVSYRNFSGAVGEREIDPYGLVLKGAVWYLVGAAPVEVRSFRADRIEQTQVLERDSTRPEGFDLETYWAQARTQFERTLPRFEVTLLVQEIHRGRLTRGVRFCRVLVQHPAHDIGEDWWRVSMTFDSEDVALEFALGFGARVQIEHPFALRQAVLQEARRLLAQANTIAPDAVGPAERP